ncbi:hypothetical protein [Lewinella sp. W8]|uniref:hypothetical protein n=1 Tax=Lewinella sp. W8 TaxID=2528208 RepID=UPI0010686D4E|nr:hypothetical protein [Lewinella sp. W8]MTB51133.1 hypothetical protein [Lewinella sp. W8]
MYYEASNRVDPLRTGVGILVAIVVIVGISYLYNALNAILPLLYACILVCLGYGILIALLAKGVVHFGKVRGKQIALGLTLLLGLVASFTQWVAFVTYIFSEEGRDLSSYLNAIPYFTSHPGDLMEGIGLINEGGTWTIGTSGMNVAGMPLAGIWLAELALLTAYPVWQVHQKVFSPYSEDQGKRYPRYVLTDNFKSIYTPGNAVAGFSERPVEYLKSIHLPGAYPISRVFIYYLAGEKDSYLSLYRIRLDEKGKEAASPIIEHLRISSREAKAILDAFPHEQDNLSDIL